MNAERTATEIHANSIAVIAECKTLVTNPRAGDRERLEAVQMAYEMGIAEGRLLGKIEMGEQLTRKGAAP
jgi:hypothetical protein